MDPPATCLFQHPDAGLEHVSAGQAVAVARLVEPLVRGHVVAAELRVLVALVDDDLLALVFGLALFVSGWVSSFGIHWSFLVMAAMSAAAGTVALQQCWQRGNAVGR